MEIIISSSSSQPIYEQITQQVKEMVMSGKLKAGEPITSMRALAKSLKVSVITVQRAYEQLQRDGFIETSVGKGSYISIKGKELYFEEQQKAIEMHLAEAARTGRRCGVSLSSLNEILGVYYEKGAQ